MKINGKKLRIALKAYDLTQEKAAHLLKVSRQTLSVWLNREELDENTLQNVKTKLGIDLTQEIGFLVKESAEIYNIRNHTEELIDQLKERLSEKDMMYQEIIDAKNELIIILKGKI